MTQICLKVQGRTPTSDSWAVSKGRVGVLVVGRTFWAEANLGNLSETPTIMRLPFRNYGI